MFIQAPNHLSGVSKLAISHIWLATCFLNKVLLEHSHVHLCDLCGCFCAPVAELSSCGKGHMACKLQVFNLWLTEKSANTCYSHKRTPIIGTLPSLFCKYRIISHTSCTCSFQSTTQLFSDCISILSVWGHAFYSTTLIFLCGHTQDLSSLTRDQTCIVRIGNSES